MQCSDLDPYPAFDHTGDVSVENLTALKLLSQVLASVPEPLKRAIDTVSENDIQTLVNSMPVKYRSHAMHVLGIRLNATRVNLPLCQDVLSRLRKSPDSAQSRHALRHLTFAPYSALFNQVWAERLSQPPVEHQWSRPLLRLAVWARLSANALDAPVWQWALQQDWVVDGFEEKEMKAVLAEVETVLAKVPTWQEKAPEFLGADDVVDAEDAFDTGDTDAGTVPLGIEELSGTLAELREHVAAANQPAERLVNSVLSGNRPFEADIAAISELATAFDLVVAQFVGSGLTVDPQLDSLEDALLAARSTAEEAGLRDPLGAVAALRAAPDSPAAPLLTIAQAQSRALAEASTWTAEDRNRAVAMGALVELVRLRDGSAGDQDRQYGLQDQWASGAPDLARLAFLVPQLFLVADEPDITVELAEPEDLDEPPEDLPEPEEPADVEEPERAPAPVPEKAPAARVDPGHVPAPSRVPAPVHPDEPVGRSAVSATEAPGADVSETPSEQAEEDPAVALVVRLLAERRQDLAYQVAVAADWSPLYQTAFRIATYAEGLRADAGGCGSALVAEMTDLDVEAVALDWVAAGLIVPAAIRTALVTGEHTAGALLNALALRLENSLGTTCSEIAHRTLSGALLECPPLVVVEDVATAEQDLEGARRACEEALAKSPRFRLQRADLIAQQWLKADGLLGSMLRRATADDRAAIPQVMEELRRIHQPSVLQAELDDQDLRFRGTGTKRLEGKVRQELVRLVQTDTQLVERWIAAVRGFSRSGSPDLARKEAEVAAMRATVLHRTQATLEALSDRARHEEGNPLGQAVTGYARESLRRTFALLAGSDRLSGQERPTSLVLSAELLKLAGVTIVSEINEISRPGTTVSELATIAGVDWRSAVSAHADAHSFDVVEYILRCVDIGALVESDGAATVLGEDVRQEAREARQRVWQELVTDQERLDGELRRARLDEAVTEGEERTLDLRLRAVTADRPDLGTVRTELDGVREQLKLLTGRRATGLRARLDALADLAPGIRERVLQALEQGQYSTADEMIAQLDQGNPIPETQDERREFSMFFPEVPLALQDGISTDLIRAVRQREVFQGTSGLDFRSLSDQASSRAVEALEGWRDMSRRGLGQRSFRESELLSPALRLMGYGSLRGPQKEEVTRGRADFRFLNLPDAEPIGQSQIPAFGSDLGTNLKIMLVWGRPSPELLLSYAALERGGGALLIAYFGTMSPQHRAALAVHSVGKRPLVVLDDAALAFLAAHGNGRLDTTMNILLPFSAANPYVSQKRSRVATEMFFGREQELEGLVHPNGPQVVFGGRGLGKSALLKRASQKFTSQSPAHSVSLLLSLDTIHFGGAASSSAVWWAIGTALEEQGVPRPKQAKGEQPGEPYTLVRSTVRAWLRGDPRRQLLILLDEADKFFESDAPGFYETRRLRDLGQDNDGRVKAVFAGLHSVQRYAKVARNSPFSHLAQTPTVVGPLSPQDAANLLAEPLSVLGYEFEDPNLILRILGYCSYQPFLLQMFGYRLVQAMHKRRSENPGGFPPYLITRDDVQNIHGDTSLRQGITSAFRDTLLLDPRYNVIANVVALNAHENGLNSQLSQAALWAACKDWWSVGFEDLDAEAFRAYLVEMEGLGVLAPDTGRGWHLRSSNALNMIGTLDEVENQLIRAASESIPEEFAALESRPQLREGGSFAPLTTSQVADVLGEHTNQVRVLLGTQATGINQVDAALRELTAQAGGWTVPPVPRWRDFERELSAGRPNEKRVVVSDLSIKGPHEGRCQETLDFALASVPDAPGVTRSAVIIAGPAQRVLWRSLLLEGREEPALGLVRLRRFSAQGLRLWTLEQPAFTGEGMLAELGEATGGWPVLVDRVAGLVKQGNTERRALSQVRSQLETAAGSAEFLELAGFVDDTLLVAAYRSIREYMEPHGLDHASLVEAAGIEIGAELAEEKLAYLSVMQVFVSDSSDGFGPDQGLPGRFVLEPVLLGCWERHYRE